jgi:CubicO group peptidase (beta-lactamase class C family)
MVPLLVAWTQSPAPPPLTDLPLDTVAATLARLVPDVLRQEGIPGLSLVLVREGKVGWAGGFGVMNRLTGRTVTDSTVFPAASLGKPIAAYAAMRLVDAGRLTLDARVSGIISPDWTADTAGPSVTLRHLLTHTAGLSNFLGDRTRAIRSPPGSRFAYSGVGFMVLQEVLETAGSGSLDHVVDSLVFAPLGMGSSSYGNVHHSAPRAYGHLAFGSVALPFVVVFAPTLVVLLVLAGVVRRLLGRPWRPTVRTTGAAVVVATGLAGGFLASKAAIPQAALTFTLLGIAALAIPVMAFAAVHRWAPVRSGVARIALGITGAALAGAILAPQPIPLPDMVPEAGNAASSLRTSAHDLGRFLEELSGPTLLAASAAASYGQREAGISEVVGWGLGIGVQTDPNGRALFHWGGNPAARSFLLCYPDRGIGIALLANGDLSRDGVVRIVEAAVGGGTGWRSH